jgi:hypothetical protein
LERGFAIRKEVMKLRDYQIDIANKAVHLLRKYKIVYLAMETRTGKTLTALYAISILGRIKKVLFVTKKKAISSILADYQKLNPKYEICVINFESLHKIKGEFDIIVIDEAHSIGAYPKPSKRTKKVKEHAKNKPIIYLSATPTPESYTQLFYQFWVSDYSPFKQKYGDNLRSFYRWSKDYCHPKKKYLYGKEFNDYSDTKIEKLKPIIDKYFIRYSQKDAGFEQVITEKVHYVEMNPALQKFIDTLIDKRYYKSSQGWEIVLDTPASLQQKHHQASSGTVIDVDGNGHILDRSKAEYIKEKFKGKKIVIFYKFKAEFNLLCDVFTNYTQSPEDFNKSGNLVFLGQFLSAREGINLSTADDLIFYNIDFSFLSYEQSKNRFQSKDRKKQTIIHWIFNKDGIEPKIYYVLKSKKDYTLNYYRKDFLCKSKNYNQKSCGTSPKKEFTPEKLSPQIKQGSQTSLFV